MLHELTKEPGRAGACAVLGLTTLVAAATAHGGYFEEGHTVVAVTAAVALAVGLAGRALRIQGLTVCLAAVGLLVAWAVVDARWHGDSSAALGYVGTLAAAAVLVLVGRATDAEARASLLRALLAAGCLLGFTGWIGVAIHHAPWALVDQNLWRAASTITYANATAAVLVPLALVALGLLASAPPSSASGSPRALRLAAFGLLLGAGATGSRGGALALLVGLAVLTVRTGARTVGRSALLPVLGAVIGLAGLMPSVPGDGDAHPWIAVGALLAGGLVAGGGRLPARTPRSAGKRGAALVLLLALAVPLVLQADRDVLRQIGAARFTLTSSDRGHQTTVAWRTARAEPVVGVGPGRLDLTWSEGDTTFRAEYVHNEYLQVLAELGGVGLLLLLAVFVAAWRSMAVARRLLSDSESAAITAALAAFLLQSGLDFVWHIPAVLLTAAFLFGLATPVPSRPNPRSSACPAPSRTSARSLPSSAVS